MRLPFSTRARSPLLALALAAVILSPAAAKGQSLLTDDLSKAFAYRAIGPARQCGRRGRSSGGAAAGGDTCGFQPGRRPGSRRF